MTDEQQNEIVRLQDQEETVFNRVRELVYADPEEPLKLITFNQETEEEIVTLAVAVGEPREDGTVVLCTLGLGELPSAATATLNNVEYGLHSELFTVAPSVDAVENTAGELAKLAFFSTVSPNPFVPGAIISEPNGTGYVFTETTLDSTTHGTPPIISEGIFLAFIAATPILPGEQELLLEEDGLNKLHEQLTNLGAEAYSSNRAPYSGE